MEVAIPDNVHMTKVNGGINPAFMNAFLKTWVGSYTIFLDKEPYVLSQNQKQQSIRAPRNVAVLQSEM